MVELPRLQGEVNVMKANQISGEDVLTEANRCRVEAISQRRLLRNMAQERKAVTIHRFLTNCARKLRGSRGSRSRGAHTESGSWPRCENRTGHFVVCERQRRSRCRTWLCSTGPCRPA